MASLSLKITAFNGKVTKTMQFEPSIIVFDACRIIRDKIPEANKSNPQDFGLFLSDEDHKKGIWLENGRTLEFYLLRDGDTLEYRAKQRRLKVRMLDGSVKTLQVDDSHTVAQLMITICSRIGITNHDEYSLVRDMPDDEKMKTLTLKRDKSIAKDQEKLDKMKKKLHTDDDLDWLDHSKTLREQGIDESEIPVLRRKFFFSDQNIDARDPVQLNLLYVQTRDAIIEGAHPVSQEEAFQFAGMQCQIHFGDHDESKHKSGFLELKEFLPKEYRKVRGAEKKIFQEHKKFRGLQEVEAKVKYTKLARSLKTYGITFFLVKEKMKGKNKLVPRLLGINKESVVKVDEKNKSIMKTWPLTNVRRWAASPNSFTLDFGDYSDAYYSVQTTEGEQIAQLIAGYIDIILKRRKAKDYLGVEEDENAPMLEESVNPARATTMQHQSSKASHASEESLAMPGVLRAGGGAQSPFTTASMQRAQFSQVSNQQARSGHVLLGGQSAQVHGLGQAQRALLGNIEGGMTAVKSAQCNLETKAELPPMGSDHASQKWREDKRDLSRQNVGAQLSAMNAATAQVVTLTSAGPDETDYTAVGSAVQTISSNIDEMSKDVRMLAALEPEPEESDNLMDAARRLANAFTDLLNAAQPGSQEPRQNLLNAASKIGEASHDIMITITDEGDVVDTNFEDALLALAKAVANATAALVLKAKDVAGQCDNQADQNKVINSATNCALATSQLVACTKVVAPTIQNPSCQEQLTDAAKLVAKSVEGVVDTAQGACKDEKSLQDLGAAATAVTKALSDLLGHIRSGATKRQAPETNAMETIVVATDQLFENMGDASQMVRQARILAQATSSLVNSLKGQAEQQNDQDQQKKLLAAAKMLADATARMVEAAKGCASKPGDTDQQARLKQAAEELRAATGVAAGSAMKKQVIHKLEIAARNAAAAATQLINASQGAAPYNRNPSSQNQLQSHCQVVGDESIPHLVQGVKGTMNDPDNINAQLALIKAAQDMLQPAGKLTNAAKGAVPTIEDQAAVMCVNNAVKNMSAALAELRSAASKAQEACGSQDIDSALDQVHNLESHLVETRRTAAQGNLVPLPGESADAASLQLGSVSKTVGSSMAQLLTAAAQGNENYTGIAAKDTANALQILANAVRGVAATTDDRDLQQHIIECALDVMDKSANLIEEAKKAVQHPNNPDNQTRLAQVAKAVSQALNNCVNCLPGLKEVEGAIKEINAISQRLATGQFPRTERYYSEVQVQLGSNAEDLSQAATDIVSASRQAPQHVANASNRFSRAYEDFMGTGMELAGATKDQESQGQIVSNLKSVSMSSSKLLLATKSLLADPNAPNSRNNLTQAARAVTESINHLINVCTESAPGQKECDNALRQIQSMRPVIENPSEPVSDQSYFECLDGVIDRSKMLGESMTGISNHAKRGETDSFCEAVRNLANAVCGLTENATQAAYLVGIADPASEPGRPGLVDQSQFARANQAIQMACENLNNPTASQQQVLAAATVIAKHTSSLCNTCRMASSRTTNPVAKRHFVQSAKDVASSTANLVKAIKMLDTDFSEDNRRKCAETARPLLQAVDELATFASSPEFASIPAKISPEARRAQEPITSSGLDMIDGACRMVQAAKQLAVNPKDPPTYQQYSSHSKEVSDSIKRLVSSIKESAPGQKECDSAIEKIHVVTRDVDRASLAAIGQNLQPRNENNLQGFQDMLLTSAREIYERIETIKTASKSEAERLGHLVSSMASYFDPLVHGAIGTASKTTSSKRQMTLLDQTKTVTESALQFMYAVKEGGGNPNKGGSTDAVQAHAPIDEMAEGIKETLQDLIQTVEEETSHAGYVSNMIDQISKSVSKTEESMQLRENASFVDYQTDMFETAKHIAKTAQDMSAKSTTNVNELGTLGNQLTKDYDRLAQQSQGAVALCNHPEVAARVKAATQDLGTACIELVQDAGNLQSNPSDMFTQRDLTEHSRRVQEKVSHLLAALQAGSQGTQACINAANTVSGIIGDLDTTIMFATAGTLNAETEEQFGEHRETILKTAKSLVEDTKTLVAGATSDQEQLATAAQSAVMTITRLADCVKLGAGSLGSEQPDAQVMLISAVKEVAAALGDLISATKNASGKPPNDPSMGSLKDSAQLMVNNVMSLLKTVRTVEDETARGTRALEATIDAINQDLRTYVATDRVEKRYTPEDLVRAAKPITMATAKAVAAGNSGRQEDVVTASNLGRKSVADLLLKCKGAAHMADSPDVKQRVLGAGHQCAQVYRDLLIQVNNTIQRATPENRQRLAEISKHVAACVQEIMHSSEILKGYDLVDPDDPIVVAESELLSAASSIEAAARKLAQLRPREKPKEANSELNFDEQILEAANSIALATAALVKAASAAQKELVAQGKVGAIREDIDDDSQWSQGLISAAHMVAAATHNLCDAANAMVQGHASEEKLISAAKSVASSTAQLLVACKVKADADSVAMKRLQTAGNSVKKATEALVRAAQQAKEGWTIEETSVTVNQRMVGGIAQIIMAKEEILIKERELEEARRKLETIQRSKYKDNQSEDEEEGTAF